MPLGTALFNGVCDKNVVFLFPRLSSQCFHLLQYSQVVVFIVSMNLAFCCYLVLLAIEPQPCGYLMFIACV